MSTEENPLKSDLDKLASTLGHAKGEPEWQDIAAKLTQKLRQVQDAASGPQGRALLDAIVDLSRAVMEIRISHSTRQGPLSRLHVPQYDLAIPFKAVDVQGTEDAVYDAETIGVINSSISSLMTLLAPAEVARGAQDEQGNTRRRADA